MGRMNEEQAVFKQLILSDFKNSSSTALKSHSSLRKFLEIENPLKMLKSAFHLKYSSRSRDI